MGKRSFLRLLLSQDAQHSLNGKHLVHTSRIEAAIRTLDSLGIVVRSFENRTTGMPILQVADCDELDQLEGCDIGTGVWYAIVNDCRVEWTPPRPFLRKVP